MKKIILSVLFIVFSICCYSQNYRVIQDFDKIPMGTRQFEAEGIMKSFSNFSTITRDIKHDLFPSDYSWIRYATKNNEMAIMLCFYKSTLYIKTFAITYDTEQLDICKEELNNIKKHIISRNKIVNKSKGELTNKAYGGVVGYSDTYYLSNSLKNEKSISATYSALLEVYEKANNFKAKIIGYTLEYSTTDLSNTELDARSGYTTFPIN